LDFNLDSDNDDLPYNKSKLSTTAMINSEHLSDRSSSPTVLKVPLAVINGKVVLYFTIILSYFCHL